MILYFPFDVLHLRITDTYEPFTAYFILRGFSRILKSSSELSIFPISLCTIDSDDKHINN